MKAIYGLCLLSLLLWFSPGAVAPANANQACTTVVGSGRLMRESRPASGFSSITLANLGQVVVQQGASEGLTVEADDNILPLLTSEVREGRLTLGIKPNICIQQANGPTFTVTVDDLSDLTLAGAGNITLQGLTLPSLTINLDGAGQVGGTAQIDTLTFVLAGAGSYAGEEIAVRAANVEISGAGVATVNARERLDVTISGSGTVRYLGDPVISEDISGIGVVRPAPSADSWPYTIYLPGIRT